MIVISTFTPPIDIFLLHQCPPSRLGRLSTIFRVDAVEFHLLVLTLRDQKMKFYSVDPKDIARRPNLEGGHCYDSTKDKKENPNFDLSHGSFWNNLFFLFGSLIHNPFTLADHFCWGCVASSCVCQCVGWVAHQPRTQKQLSLSLS